MIEPSSDEAGPGPLDITAFLDDYFIECDEHLAVARRSVLALEPLIDQPHVNRAVLDELFRSFHSLKGLSGMVGVREAEQLSHQLENYLVALRKGDSRLSPAGIEALVAGVSGLEQVVTARRDARAMPDVTSLADQIARLVSTVGPAMPAAAEPSGTVTTKPGDLDSLIAEKTRTGGSAWRVCFRPSAASAQRGLDVNEVRRRLQDMGELLHSEPKISAGGGIEFHFVVVQQSPETPLGDIKAGLTFEPYASPSPALISSQVTVEETREVAANTATHLAPANLVRVDLSRLDELMRLVGEMVLSRARLDDAIQRINGSMPSAQKRSLQEINLSFEHQLRDLREGVMRVRMVPIREVFARMQFVVRDLVREHSKKVVLQSAGEDTQIDKYVVERMMDPLLHLVRNAVSHGLETPNERRAAGKSAEAKIALRATATGDTIQIEVEDDGRGIDAAAVFARAETLGLIPPATAIDTATLLEILCTPGFSMRAQADRESGRGVGMDVVLKTVEELGGTLGIETELGRGTRFTIQLPLTLAIADALIVEVAGQRYAAPQASIREVMQIDWDRVLRVEKNELLPHHDRAIPLLRLARFFGVREDVASNYVLVVGEGVQAVGLVVDRMLGLREIVVRPLTDRFVQVPGISGATELGDGQAVLILDIASLVRASRRQPLAPRDVAIAAKRSLTQLADK